MYHRGKKKDEIKEVPFEIICTNCGSHNVDVDALEHQDLQLRCKKCGSYVHCGTYNETKYNEMMI